MTTITVPAGADQYPILVNDRLTTLPVAAIAAYVEKYTGRVFLSEASPGGHTHSYEVTAVRENESTGLLQVQLRNHPRHRIVWHDYEPETGDCLYAR